MTAVSIGMSFGLAPMAAGSFVLQIEAIRGPRAVKRAIGK
jgi:hypothetical protein